jgi:hypothetical protein
MEIVLLIITVVSLAVAGVTSMVAWRATREERARGAARVAALVAAANDSARPAPDEHLDVSRREESSAPAQSQERVLEPRKTALWPAAAPWRTAHGASQPVASAAVQQAPAVQHAPAARPAPGGEAGGPGSIADNFLGTAISSPPSDGRQRMLAAAAVVLFVAALGGGYWQVYGGRSATARAASPVASAPLELVALGHERQGSRLAITGVVRNPTGGGAVDRLAAVAFLFDQHGEFVTSARAGVDFLQLVPGDESPFVVRVEAPASVTRYRVSFRNEAGVVPHIDRRVQEGVQE